MDLRTILLAACLLIPASNASAAFINGDIAFSAAPGSSLTFTEDDLTTVSPIQDADGIKFNSGTSGDGLVVSGTGDYSGVSLSPITYVDFKDFVFNPSTPAELWSFSSGGNTYSFSMSIINIISQTTNTISLEGTGVASITGLDNTPGDFSLTMNENGEVTSFSSSASVIPIPAAVWLFGSGLLGLVGIARRRKTT